MHHSFVHSRCFGFIALFACVSILVMSSCGKKTEPGTTDKQGQKQWKISIVKYEDLEQTEQTEKGITEGLKAAGLEEGKDFTIVSRGAMGDLPTVLSLIDKAVAEKTDLIVSLQTPTLHAAVQRGGAIPIVFMVVANPFVISNIGKNDSTHLPNVTGVYTMSTFDKMIEHIKACLPRVKKIGTLYALPELNAQFYKNSLIESAAKAGLKLEAVGVTSKLDIPSASLALCSKGIDAICQIEDNLTSSTFTGIAKAAQKAKVPIFSFVSGQVKEGSSIVIAPDYTGASKDAANIIARIIRGENPEKIPFQRIRHFPLLINLEEAKAAGMIIPQDIISEASQVIGAQSGS